LKVSNILRTSKDIKIEELRGAEIRVFENINEHSNNASICTVREFGCNSEIGGSKVLG
jgi:hypothetical protein